MGEVADMILEGILCMTCGGYIESEAQGVPRLCENCEKDPENEGVVCES